MPGTFEKCQGPCVKCFNVLALGYHAHGIPAHRLSASQNKGIFRDISFAKKSLIYAKNWSKITTFYAKVSKYQGQGRRQKVFQEGGNKKNRKLAKNIEK